MNKGTSEQCRIETRVQCLFFIGSEVSVDRPSDPISFFTLPFQPLHLFSPIPVVSRVGLISDLSIFPTPDSPPVSECIL